MSRRLKVMACGYVSRDDKNILRETQLNLLDTVTNKTYNVFCESCFIGQEDGDCYRIKVCGASTDDVIDECIIDSSGGIFMDDDFAYDNFDEQVGDEIVSIIIDLFIIPF